MSTTINMTGKPTAGGGGKGGGESKFERLWHQVLRDPNPSTIRTFKELFDVADPSQTLFGGGKGAGTGTAGNATGKRGEGLVRSHDRRLQIVRENGFQCCCGSCQEVTQGTWAP